jgi:hypothetical protein
MKLWQREQCGFVAAAAAAGENRYSNYIQIYGNGMDADFIVETYIYIYFLRDNKHVCVQKKYNEFHGYVSSNPDYSFRTNKLILMKMHNLPDSMLVLRRRWVKNHYAAKYGKTILFVCNKLNIDINSIYKICKKTTVYSIKESIIVPTKNEIPLVKKVDSFPPPRRDSCRKRIFEIFLRRVLIYPQPPAAAAAAASVK